jgi:2-keto-3-deoxy-L-rhamnonate aldolase RhmA
MTNSNTPSPGGPLRARIASGGVGLCLGVRQARTPDIAQIAAACGFDALYVDLEHSTASLDTTSAICIAAQGVGVTPLVRVPESGGAWIARVLDGGARGVIVPHVERVEEAEAIVRQAKYPPLGKRSVMGTGPQSGYRAVAVGDASRGANDDVMVIAMLETPAGIAAAHAIAAVPGIDMLLIGSNDLCTELGIPGQFRDPRLREAFATAAAACRAHGRILGIGGIRGDGTLQRELVDLGARFIIAGNDVSYLLAAARDDVTQLRGSLSGERRTQR